MSLRIMLFAAALAFAGCKTEEEDALESMIRRTDEYVADRRAMLANLTERKREFAELDKVYSELSAKHDSATLLTRLGKELPEVKITELSASHYLFETRHELELSGEGDAVAPLGKLSSAFNGLSFESFALADGRWTARVRLPLLDLEPVTEPAAFRGHLTPHTFWSFRADGLRAELAKSQAECADLDRQLADAGFPDGPRFTRMKLMVAAALRNLRLLDDASQPAPAELAQFRADGPFVEGKLQLEKGKLVGEGTVREGVDAASVSIPGAKILSATARELKWERTGEVVAKKAE